MSTIKEIAKKCNLSSATVSRVLRNDPGISVSPEARIKIQQAVDLLGLPTLYKKPQTHATAIAVIHRHIAFRNQIDSSYYYAIRSGIEEYCINKKISVTFIPISQFKEAKKDYCGYIIVGNLSYQDFAMIIGDIGSVPAVCIGIVSYFHEKVDQISFSNKKSVTMGLEYLLENGHTEIGYIGVIEAAGTTESRKQVYIDYMKAHRFYNKEWLRECEHGSDRVEQGYNLMKDWLKEGTKLPSAIFIANDPVALGVVNAINESGLRIPDDISIVSHDFVYSSQFSSPALTTVDVHPYELGREGTKALLEKINQERTISETILLEPELQVRSSVRRNGVSPKEG
ncbi:MAG: LacI family DNA-binding transcriptional regulator [Sphaerochaetaceae bacterium]|nr:LacI family DNA-binding transcriptional regulator [Sphaerochaetaceae bacterium]